MARVAGVEGGAKTSAVRVAPSTVHVIVVCAKVTELATNNRPRTTNAAKRNFMMFLLRACAVFSAGFAFFRHARLRRVVAFAVDRRHLGSHGTQVHRELSAMVDGVTHHHLNKSDRRELEEAAKV